MRHPIERATIAGAAVLALALGVTACSFRAPARTAAATVTVTVTATPSPTPTPTPFSYADAGVVLSLKTREHKCFSLGECDYTVVVQVNVEDSSLIPDDASGTITFEITGGKNGPITDSVELNGTRYTEPTEFFEVANNKTVPKVRVTSIDMN